jgi:hypothetical protein
MRYRLRTLLILLAILPPLLAISWVKWQEYREHLAEQQRRAEYHLRAANGLRINIPAAGPVAIEGQNPSATSPSGAPSNEQVFSFHIGITR